MDEFGGLLRNFRESCKDPAFPTRRLSQEKFGELLGAELGTAGYSGAAVSDWERGKSKIHADNRLVLRALIKVLYENGGLKTVEQAKQLLEAGNYRALNADERGKVFTEIPNNPNAQQDTDSNSNVPSLEEGFLAVIGKEFKVLIAKAKEEGPDPWWPRALAALISRVTDHISLSLNTILWIWVWLIAWRLIASSLRLPFHNQNEILLAMQKYVMGTLIVPLLIGSLIRTKDNDYWKQQSGVNPLLLRIYTYQGAGIGFNLGYFFVFPFSLLRNYLHLEPTVWTELLAATAGLIFGNMGARVVPHNLWRAFGRLAWSDGAIFFFVALIGPLWAFFFMDFYPVLLNPTTGILVFLLAVTMIVVMTTRKSKKHDK